MVEVMLSVFVLGIWYSMRMMGDLKRDNLNKRSLDRLRV